MRSSLAIALVVAATSSVFAQGGPDPAEPPPEPPPAEPVEPGEPTGPIEPAPEPSPAVPSAEPATPTLSTDAAPGEKRTPFQGRGLVLGFEAGLGGATGTPAQIYGAGIGTGVVIGYRYDRFSIEGHLLQSYALSAKDDQLESDSTLGSLTVSSALFLVRLLDAPVAISAALGAASLSAPVYVVTAHTSGEFIGDQLIETRSMRGVGLIFGGALAYPVTPRLEVGVDLRKVFVSKWELPALEYVVPGARAPDGSVMYTTSTQDASSSPWTATLILRVLL